MKKSISIVVLLVVLLAMFSAGCASSGYSPPPERRAGERCPIGETWVCRDRYPSRMDRDEEPMFCTCENMQRVR